MNLILIGYRGVGKSSVGRELAKRMKWDFVDSDDEIESRAGKSIAAIFADGGEQVFRDLESLVIEDLARRKQTVLAVGGGAVLRPANREALRGSGRIVWLQADARTILERVAADDATASRRPNLTTSGGEAEIIELLNKRTPTYRQCADLAVDTVGRSPAEVAVEVVDRCALVLETEPA